MRQQRQTYQAALVTGASRGLGRAFVDALADDTDLVLTARDRSELDAVATACARPGRRIETIAADLTCASDQQIVIRAARECDVDLVITNADAGSFGKFVESDIAAQIAAVRLNIESTLNIAHALLPDMIRQARTAHRRAGMVVVRSGRFQSSRSTRPRNRFCCLGLKP
jgi:short-subunit dehydrogenase